jgi:hypothetical protein
VSLPAGGGFFVARDHDKGDRVTVIESPGSARSEIPKRVSALGRVSMPMVISSGMISALPLFLVTVLGTSMVTVGLIKAIAEAAAAALLAFAGTALIGATMAKVAVG